MINSTQLLKFIMCILLGLFVGTIWALATAEGYEVPKDAVIKVFDANGKQIGEMSRSEYKVVKLKSKARKTPVRPSPTPRPSSNEVILHVGKAPNGLDVVKNANTYSISKDEEVVFGATYCHTPKQDKYDLGICGTYLSNDTFLGGFKFGF